MDLLPIPPVSVLPGEIKPAHLFRDRDELVRYFRSTILEPPKPAHNIIAIWGPDGLGKSTLLSHFINEASTLPLRDYCIAAMVNYRHTSPPIIMGEFAEQLRRHGHALPLFERGLRTSTDSERASQLKSSQETARILRFQRLLTSTRAFFERLPLLNKLPGNRRKNTALALPEEFPTRNMLGSSNPLLQEVLLTQAFVKDLNQLTRAFVRVKSDESRRERRIILFFDAFEHLPRSTVSWFLNRFLVQMISNQVVLVLAGTEPIDPKIADDPRHWSNYEAALENISLHPLSPDQTRAYLAEKGITEDDLVAQVWGDSQGIPIKVDILATQLKLDSQAPGTIEHKLVLHAALFSRPFIEDDLAAFRFIPSASQPTLFQWLTSLPFAHKTLSGRYNYHKLAREQFGTHFYNSYPEEYMNARRELAAYYRRLLDDKFPETSDQTFYTSPGWLELKLALAYQWFLAPEKTNHVRALLQVLHAYQNTRRREEIRQMLDEVAEDTPSMGLSEESLQLINQLRRYISADQPGKESELLEAANDLLVKSIPDRPGPASSPLLPGIIAGVYLKRGMAAFSLQNYKQALDDFERALHMNAKPNNQGFYLPSVAFQTFFSQGLYHKQHQEYLQAIKRFTAALDLDGTSAETRAHRGDVYRLIQDYDHAIKDFDCALTAGFQEPWAYLGRGIAYKVYQDGQEADKAIQDFTRFLDSNPMDVEVYVHRAEAYSLCKDYGQALLDLQQALELNPESAAAYMQRGLVNRELNEYDHALEDLTQAVTLDPKNVKTYLSRGRLYRLQGKYEEAIGDFTQALKLSSYSAEIYTSRGEAYRQRGETSGQKEHYKQAIADFKRALTLDPLYARAYASRAETHRLNGSPEQAIDDFNRALALDDTSAWAFAQRGETYKAQKNYERAIADFKAALSLDPTNALVYAHRGDALCSLGSYKQGIDDLDRAIHLAPNLVSAYYDRGRAYMHLKEYKRALDDFNRAVKVAPNLAMAYLQRGRIHIMLREYPYALENLERAISLDPGNAWTYHLRGLARLGLRELRRARTDFERCWALDASIVNAACMAEWTRICEEGIDRGMSKRLDDIAGIDADRYESQVCQGVAFWLHENFAEALEQLEQACRLRPDRWDAFFWRGVVCASLDRAEEAITMITSALELGMPPALLAALDVLKASKPAFYQVYARPLLSRYNGQESEQGERE
ncbi:MAG TPA: tetratricopeptide repeat protein [Ktedonobacteraceae bacterium]|nr:tetratricopeptide repeat protein [Ktedonobacteraceae bacterium]